MDTTDEKDAVLIARLTAQLRCYVPEQTDETWARLRHLGARREQLITESIGQVQQMRDLLECVWPAVLETAQQPFRSHTWIAGLAVVVDRDGGDLARTSRLGAARFEHAVRREIAKRGGLKPCLRIVREVFAALPTRPASPRTGPARWSGCSCCSLTGSALTNAWPTPRPGWWPCSTSCSSPSWSARSRGSQPSVPQRSWSPGDPHRFATARALVKHAGLAPREKLSGTFKGRTRLTGQGRPGLRLAAWRAVWGAQRATPVYERDIGT